MRRWSDDLADESTAAGPPAPPGGSSTTSPAAVGGSGQPGQAGKGGEGGKARQRPLWQEMLLLVAIALGLAMVIKTFFVQAFYIPSDSMYDTLVEDDRILVQKVSYWAGDVQRGDVVVFDDPGGWLAASEVQHASNPLTRTLELFGLYPSGGHLVKRVIGVGGDRVECCDAKGRITVNGVALREHSYLASGTRPSDVRFKQVVPEGHLWVMGDNRSASSDSRAHLGAPGGGFVPVDAVVGRVFVVVWPLGHAQLLERPETFANPALDGR